MKNFLKVLLAILIVISSFTWEIIQNVFGLLCLVFTFLQSIGTKRFKIKFVNGEILVTGNFFSSGVSLGRFIILDYHYETYSFAGVNLFETTINHEWGHSRQSLMLGPLYLIVVGIPSALHNLYNRGLYKNEKNSYRRHALKEKEYYSWYCEKWADKLGKVDRSYLDTVLG